MTAMTDAREWRMVVFPVSPAGPSGGNPAGVVFDPVEEDAGAMTRTAVRLNPLSETAFVWPARDGVHRLRYFAPGGEVELCGHATAAAYGALAASGRVGALPVVVRSDAPGGQVSGRVERVGDGIIVSMDMPVARRVDATLDVAALAEALGLPPEVVTSRPAAAVEDVGIRVALVPLPDLAALDAMRPDFPALMALGRAERITVVYPFVLDGHARQVRARSFAPAVGIDEDPATGTAAAALGAYLAREALLERDAPLVAGVADLRVRQGEAMGRPSELRLRVEHDGHAPTAVRVGGWVSGEPVTP